MKRKINNKGFTLVELLATLVIIIAITSIAMTTISASLERSKNKKEEAQNKLYISAAKLYISAHRHGIINKTCCISIQALIEEGYLERKDDIPDKGCVEVEYIDENDESIDIDNQQKKREYEFKSGTDGGTCLDQ